MAVERFRWEGCELSNPATGHVPDPGDFVPASDYDRLLSACKEWHSGSGVPLIEVLRDLEEKEKG